MNDIPHQDFANLQIAGSTRIRLNTADDDSDYDVTLEEEAIKSNKEAHNEEPLRLVNSTAQVHTAPVAQNSTKNALSQQKKGNEDDDEDDDDDEDGDDEEDDDDEDDDEEEDDEDKDIKV